MSCVTVVCICVCVCVLLRAAVSAGYSVLLFLLVCYMPYRDDISREAWPRRNVYWSRPSVCLLLAAFPCYWTDPDVTWRNDSGCPLVVHYWVDLQSVHRFRCYDSTAPTTKCQRVLVLALRLVALIEQINTEGDDDDDDDDYFFSFSSIQH